MTLDDFQSKIEKKYNLGNKLDGLMKFKFTNLLMKLWKVVKTYQKD